ncbi:MAG TPA: response regulator transcription factor [Nitrospirae bacterium]|nr:response regulator UvrY [bacterium BMS3Abin09]HDN94484.1 response regulator transcription factor [Nitrospirota bacterium]HDZ84093.1 response regulator transcription factor [Nitrospirota bacterium]
MLKILIADDHAIVREGIKQILAEIPEKVTTDEAINAQEVIQKVWENEYDMVLLDISMPGRSGLDVLKQLRSEKPALKILILSMHPEEQYAIRALKAGASGYLTKESTPHELTEAIKKVSIGKKYVSASLAETLASHLETTVEKPLHEALSNREFEVMCMIASGKTVKEIAEDLSLSVKTISTYRTRILGKMNMKNNSQITHYTIQSRLVD